MRYLPFIVTLFLFCLPVKPSFAGAGIVVLELFTAQGCSTTPPADEIFEKIVNEDLDIIALSCHVTYFDKEDVWTDTLSQGFCDDRHKKYYAGLDLGSINTPQAVVNGRYPLAGDDEEELIQVLEKVRENSKILPVALEPHDNVLDITLPAMDFKEPADVYLLTYEPAASVEITGGINLGKTIRYANYATHYERLIYWDGRAGTISYPLEGKTARRYVVIAQYADFSGVLAAGKITLPAPN